jgi:hypothetical protein
VKSRTCALAAVTACIVCAVGGFAVGAYIQFLHTVLATQDSFARDVITAKSLARNQSSDLVKWMMADAPLQYRYLTEFDKVRSQPFPLRLAAVARMTWTLRSIRPEEFRSPEQLQNMMRDCACGLTRPLE